MRAGREAVAFYAMEEFQVLRTVLANAACIPVFTYGIARFYAQGNRALALYQLGQDNRAVKEMR